MSDMIDRNDMIVKSGLAPTAAGGDSRMDTVAGWRIVSGYGDLEAEVAAARESIALADVSAVGKLVIQGQDIESILAGTFGSWPAVPTEVATFDDGWITRMNRYEYYATLPLERLDATVVTLRGEFEGMHAHVTSLTHGRDALALAGPYAAETLSKLCALDLHPDVFPSPRALIGSVAGVTTLIARLDKAGVPYCELHVDRSYGHFLWEVISDAAEEFDGRVIGAVALAQL